MNWNKFSAVAAGGLIVLCLIVFFFKPEEARPSKVPESSKAPPDTVLAAAQESGPQRLKQPDNQTELLRQRDQLYSEFAALSQSLSQGQKPDVQKVEMLLQKQIQLVSSGVLSAQDALNYCQFLRKIMPEMQGQLNGYIDQLEKM